MSILQKKAVFSGVLNARGRNRTGTTDKGQRILSPFSSLIFNADRQLCDYSETKLNRSVSKTKAHLGTIPSVPFFIWSEK